MAVIFVPMRNKTSWPWEYEVLSLREYMTSENYLHKKWEESVKVNEDEVKTRESKMRMAAGNMLSSLQTYASNGVSIMQS